MSTVNFHCYRPAPAWTSLPPLEQKVLAVLRDARGIFKSSGLTVADTWRRLTVGMARKPKLTTNRSARIALAMERLVDAGAAQVVGNRWKIA